ncbi:MurR/RpiR family transcriptional regulator [uncultured Lactobacillus sp.]|uniref:MurR/RpiR family transcriptional regulator n=1 Tax=uncultured Lactobacillus sp. TaxID=153152 RepID=UPI0025EA2447|nr:MurR/RpiR family transcriptional regulator [uncultured Lactobacillus sp.]
MKLKDFLKPKNDILSKSDQKIYEVVLQQPTHIQLLTIQKIATDSKTSIASVQRYCKKLGYDGFKEFKFQLKNFLLQQDYSGNNKSTFLKEYIKAVSDFKNIDKTELENLANDLLKARQSFLMGIYYSSIPAKQLAMGLHDLNKPSFYTDNYVTASHWSGLMENSDAFVLFSVSGDETSIKKYLSETLHRLKKTYLITFNPDTPLRKQFKHCIVLPGKAFVYNSSIDTQSLVSLFVEMIIEKIVQIRK